MHSTGARGKTNKVHTTSSPKYQLHKTNERGAWPGAWAPFMLHFGASLCTLAATVCLKWYGPTLMSKECVCVVAQCVLCVGDALLLLPVNPFGYLERRIAMLDHRFPKSTD